MLRIRSNPLLLLVYHVGKRYLHSLMQRCGDGGSIRRVNEKLVVDVLGDGSCLFC
jgi:hypothetical protein